LVSLVFRSIVALRAMGNLFLYPRMNTVK